MQLGFTKSYHDLAPVILDAGGIYFLSMISLDGVMPAGVVVSPAKLTVSLQNLDLFPLIRDH